MDFYWWLCSENIHIYALVQMSFNILKQTKQNKKVAALFFKKNKHVCTLFTGNKTFLKQRKAVSKSPLLILVVLY